MEWINNIHDIIENQEDIDWSEKCLDMETFTKCKLDMVDNSRLEDLDDSISESLWQEINVSQIQTAKWWEWISVTDSNENELFTINSPGWFEWRKINQNDIDNAVANYNLSNNIEYKNDDIFQTYEFWDHEIQVSIKNIVENKDINISLEWEKMLMNGHQTDIISDNIRAISTFRNYVAILDADGSIKAYSPKNGSLIKLFIYDGMPWNPFENIQK